MQKEYTEAELYTLLEDMGLPVKDVQENRHYWFVRTQGGSYFEEFFGDEFVGIGHEDVPCLPKEERTDALLEQIKKNHPQATRVMNQVYKFCKEIHRGDIVIIPSASSAQFAFGIIEDDEIYTVPPLTEDEIAEGRCPYTRRRKTHWIQGIPKARVDSKLYMFFRNQQALSQVDSYSDFIERAIHPFYVKDGIAHLTLSVNTPDSPSAFDMPLYIGGILARAKDLYAELNLGDENSFQVQSRTNVQSAGLIELLGTPAFILLIAVIVVGLFGGKIKYHSDPDKGTDAEISTEGLIGAITKILDRFDKHHEMISDKKLRDVQKRLRVQNPAHKHKKKKK